MLSRILQLFGRGGKPKASGVVLPTIDREALESLMHRAHGLPHVDWAMADVWAARKEPSPFVRAPWMRAIASGWLDAIRDELEEPHRRWRGASVEGLGPVEDDLAVRMARASDRAVIEIERALKPIRGESAMPTVAIVGLKTMEDYYSFIANEYPEEGEFATSGGVYIHERSCDFPVIAMPLAQRQSVESTVAHELTHHALWELDLPLWAEEGLTQMMEERVTGVSNFVFNHEIRDRHIEHWGHGAIRRFWEGAGFHSPHEDEQELSYNLSQAIVRSLLSDRPAAFFAFARASRSGDSGRAAAREHFGVDLSDLAARVLGPGRW